MLFKLDLNIYYLNKTAIFTIWWLTRQI